MGGFGVDCAISVTGLEFLLCGDRPSVVGLTFRSFGCFLWWIFFSEEEVSAVGDLLSSVSGQEVRQVEVWAS